MKKFILTLVILSFKISFFAQWEWQNPNPQGNTLLNLIVTDSTHAWASGSYGSLIYTNDGLNWKLYKDLDMVDEPWGDLFYFK